MDDETIFSSDPVDVAGRWVAASARRLHLVDLNGAFAGKAGPMAIINQIAAAFPGSANSGGGWDPRREDDGRFPLR